MKNHFPWILLALISLVLSTGCASKALQSSWASRLSTIKDPIGPEEILRLPQADPITFSQLLDDLGMARIVYVGESHDQIEHHRIQVGVIEGLLAKGKDVAIGMEMFERSQQAILDRWSEGLLTEEEFLKEIHWETTWGMDYDFYKGILDMARSHHLKILGLNVPRDLVRRVAENGMKKLSSVDKQSLPEMDLTDRQHRAYIATIYERHGKGSAKDFENFYEAQCLWDEGMAESLFHFLKSSQAERKTVLVFAGSGHVVFNFGIPKRLSRRMGVTSKTILLKAWTGKPDLDSTFTETTSPPADFLWVTKPNPPEKKQPRIGVILQPRHEGQEGLRVEWVLPGSPAEKAGLLPGDKLIGVEGNKITKVKDIHKVLEQKGWGKEVSFTVLREGVKKEVILTLMNSEE